jgi:hypothetical protein
MGQLITPTSRLNALQEKQLTEIFDLSEDEYLQLLATPDALSAQDAEGMVVENQRCPEQEK